MNPVRQNVKFDKKLIDKDALKVVKTLVKNGYEAYLVGGCIRDLLLGLQPKDFDIATSATPEQIHKVFKRSRIIGRRFKLVHIMFSARKYIEVATFRAGKVKTSNKGQVIRDNFYGSLKDDVFRRDFTVNALYYDVVKFQVIDYVNGLEDLKASQINIIGRASERFEEDPVRMIRAIRFKVKLEAELNPEISKNINSNAYLLKNIPSARLYEEVIKLFHNENSIGVYKELLNFGLFNFLFSQTQESLFINSTLINTSKRIKRGDSVTPAFLFAVFLWDAQKKCLSSLRIKNKTQIELMVIASEEVIRKQIQQIMMPRWLSQRVKDIWLMQKQLENCNDNKANELLNHPRFRMAYDFLLLRSESINPELKKRAKFWTNLQK